MSGYFFAIGGANYEKNESLMIDLDIIKETKKNHPVVLFVPRANFDDQKKINIFCDYYEKLGAKVNVLYSLNNKITLVEIQRRFSEADIIYFSGGITSELIKFVTEYNIKEELIKNYKLGKIIVGVSAGAILFFEKGFGDKEAYQFNLETVNYKMTDGIGIFKGIFCPHYQNNGLLIFHDEVKKYTIDAFAVENGAALKINDDSYVIIKTKGCNAFKFDFLDNYKLTYLKDCELYKNNLFNKF